jgi:Na+/melibiose symporter-like transporter
MYSIQSGIYTTGTFFCLNHIIFFWVIIVSTRERDKERDTRRRGKGEKKREVTSHACMHTITVIIVVAKIIEAIYVIYYLESKTTTVNIRRKI